jgi:hypothetical protein
MISPEARPDFGPTEFLILLTAPEIAEACAKRSGARLSDTGLQERPVDQTGLALNLADPQPGIDGERLITLGVPLGYRGSGMA